MKKYPKIPEERKQQLIDFMEKYRKKGEINRKVIVDKKNNQNEYDFMHDWLESNNIEIIGKRVDEYEYSEPLEEKEISKVRQKYLINYLEENIKKNKIPEYLLFQIQKNDNELDFMYDWLEDRDIIITGINSSLIGEIPNFKNIFRDGKDKNLPDYEPLSANRKQQLKYSIKKGIINKSISNDELLKLAQDELEYLYMYDWLKKSNIKINNIDSKHKNIKKSYKEEAYEKANERDMELFKKMEQGDKEARKKIIENSLRLASWVANNYKSIFDDLVNVEYEDKLHYARVGLIKAVDRFDYKKGYKFATYAVQSIRWNIDRDIYKELLIKTPKHIIDKIYTIKRIQENFEKMGIHPTDEMILESAPDFGSIDRIRELRHAAKMINYESLDKETDYETKILNSDDSQKIQEIDDEIFEDGIYYEEDPEEEMVKMLSNDLQENNIELITDEYDLKESINKVLRTLTEREEKVLRLRFGLEDGRSQSLEEVARVFKVTRERLRQIEAKALRKLRHPNRSDKVRNHYVNGIHDGGRYIEEFNGTAPYQAGLDIDLEKNLEKFAIAENEVESKKNNYDDDVIEKKPDVEFEELLEQNEIPEKQISEESEKVTNDLQDEISEDFNTKFEFQQLCEKVEEIRNMINNKTKELHQFIHDKQIRNTKKEELKALFNELEKINNELNKQQNEEDEKEK